MVMTYIPQMYKAIVPLFVGLVITGLSYFDVTPTMSVEDAVTLLVTSGLVWLVPNK